MGPLVVPQHFVWSCSVFVYFVGSWFFGLLRLVVYHLLEMVGEGCPGHDPFNLLLFFFARRD